MARSTWRWTATRSAGSDVVALVAVEQVGQALGQLGADAGGLLDGVGELGRVGRGQADHRHVGVPRGWRGRRRCRRRCAGR